MRTPKVVLCLLTAVAAIGLTSCNDDGPSLSLIGLDKDGKEVKVKVSQSQFTPRFSEILNTTSVSSLETLAEEEARGNWGLQEAEVGVNLQVNGNIILLVNIGAGTGASLTLSRQGGNND